MLGETTKCDLSAGIAKLDITTLTKQIENHFYSIASEIQKKITLIRNNSLRKQDREDVLLSMVSNGSNELVRLSNSLAETAEILYTLYNTKDRDIEIVNQ